MSFAEMLGVVNGFVWGPIMLTLLVGTGVYLTLRCGFIQFVHMPRALKLVFSRKKEEGEGAEVSEQDESRGFDDINHEPFGHRIIDAIDEIHQYQCEKS